MMMMMMIDCLCFDVHSLQETYEQKRSQHLAELQRKEDEMRQMFVVRVKEKESELKEAEKEVRRHDHPHPSPPPSNHSLSLLIINFSFLISQFL